jgi:signal transduction histidine kinase
VLISWPQNSSTNLQCYSFSEVLAKPPLNFNNKIVLIGGLMSTNKNLVKTPVYQQNSLYQYRYDTEFIGIGISNLLQQDKVSFVQTWSEINEYLYFIIWLLTSGVFIWLISIDLPQKDNLYKFILAVVFAWIGIVSGIFIVSFGVFPQLWIPAGWIWIGVSINIITNVIAILDIQVKEEQQKVIKEQQKRLAQEEEYNERLTQEIEKLKNTLLMQERLAFIGKVSPFLRHKLLNFYDDFYRKLYLAKDFTSQQEDKLLEIFTLLEDSLSEEEIDNYREEFLNDLESSKSRLNQMEEILKNSSELITRFLPMLRGKIHDDLLNPQYININELLQESRKVATFDFKLASQEFNLEIIEEFEPNLKQLWGVPSELQFAFVNLLENAYQAVFERFKVSNSSYEPTVWLITKQTNFNLIIMIKDNGIGIDKDLIDKIFEPLFSTKKKHHQTGVGLTLTRDIIEFHYQGTVRVDIINGLTCFIVEFPLSSL